MIFLGFAKNESLQGLTLPYNQFIIHVMATLCTIFMALASKLWPSQWFEAESFSDGVLLFAHCVVP